MASAELVELLRELAAALIQSGASAPATENALIQVAQAQGAACKAVVQVNSVILDVDGQAAMVADLPGLLQFDAQDDLERILQSLADRRLAVAEAREQLRQALARPPRYGFLLRLLGYAAFSAGLGLLEQATGEQLAVSAITGLFVGALLLVAEGKRGPSVLAPLWAAALVSTLVLGALDRGLVHGGPVLMIIPALIFLLPGDVLTVAMFEIVLDKLDAGTSRLISGLSRLLMLAAGTAVGVAIVGAPASVLETTRGNTLGHAGAALGVLLFGLGMAIYFGMRWKAIPWTLGILFAGWAVQQIVRLASVPILGSFCGAVTIAFLSIIVGGKPGRPSTMALTLPGFFVLVPGDIGFEGLALLMGGHYEGFKSLLEMLVLLAVLAFGYVAGTLAGLHVRKTRVLLGPA
jgi:uncharacterized membrane protein YjjP (DUF1212 family)